MSAISEVWIWYAETTGIQRQYKEVTNGYPDTHEFRHTYCQALHRDGLFISPNIWYPGSRVLRVEFKVSA